MYCAARLTGAACRVPAVHAVGTDAVHDAVRHHAPVPGRRRRRRRQQPPPQRPARPLGRRRTAGVAALPDVGPANHLRRPSLTSGAVRQSRLTGLGVGRRGLGQGPRKPRHPTRRPRRHSARRRPEHPPDRRPEHPAPRRPKHPPSRRPKHPPSRRPEHPSDGRPLHAAGGRHAASGRQPYAARLHAAVSAVPREAGCAVPTPSQSVSGCLYTGAITVQAGPIRLLGRCTDLSGHSDPCAPACSTSALVTRRKVEGIEDIKTLRTH